MEKNKRTNVGDIVHQISDITGFSQGDVHLFLAGLISVIRDNIADGHDVAIRDFGRFYKAKTKGRRFKSGLTGSVHDVPEKEILKFTSFKPFNEWMAQKKEE